MPPAHAFCPSFLEHWRTWDKCVIHWCLQCLVRSWHTTQISRMARWQYWPAAGSQQQQAAGCRQRAAGSRRGALGSGKASPGTDGTLILGAALHTAHTDNGDKWMCYRFLREKTGTNLRVKRYLMTCHPDCSGTALLHFFLFQNPESSEILSWSLKGCF